MNYYERLGDKEIIEKLKNAYADLFCDRINFSDLEKLCNEVAKRMEKQKDYEERAYKAEQRIYQLKCKIRKLKKEVNKEC